MRIKTILILTVTLFLAASCSYASSEYPEGKVLCLALDPSVKVQIINNLALDRRYVVRIYVKSERTNTSPIFRDGNIQATPFSEAIVEKYELTECR